MNAPARSVFLFGLYMGGEGAILMLAPNVLLGLFGLPPTNEVWIRVVGWALVVLAIYYVQAARNDLRPFFRWSANVRMLQFAFFAALVAARLAPPVLLAFSAVELASGIWTALLIRREGSHAVERHAAR